MFLVPFPIFFLTPIVVPFLGLSAAQAAAVIGSVLLGVELVWFASIPLLGKQGFLDLKKRAFSFLKLTEGPITRSRHRFGVTLLVVSLVVEVLMSAAMTFGYAMAKAPEQAVAPVLGLAFQDQALLYVFVEIATTAGLVVSVFILGADFWERFKRLFEWPGAEEPT